MAGGVCRDHLALTLSSLQSNNLVIHSAMRHFRQACTLQGSPEGTVPHVVTCSVEHDSIRLPLERLVQEGAAGECQGGDGHPLGPRPQGGTVG